MISEIYRAIIKKNAFSDERMMKMNRKVSIIASVITAVVCLGAGGVAGHHYTKMQYDADMADRNTVHAAKIRPSEGTVSVENAVEADIPENADDPDIRLVGGALHDMFHGELTMKNVYTVVNAVAFVAAKAAELAEAEAKIVITEDQVRTSIEPAEELVTQNYRYTSADTYKKYYDIEGWTVPFTTDESVFTYEGVIKAGINFADIGISVDNDAQIITVELPEPYIISHEIDENSFQVYDVKDSVFTETDLPEYASLIAELKQKREDAYNSEPENRENVIRSAQTAIEGMLNAEGLLKEHSVVFR